ncbi:MAG: DUF6149 family protein [Halobacterium sp.]
MRLYQTWKNYAAQLALGVPVVDALVRRWLVRLHTEVFVDLSAQDGDARRPHLRALFDASVDAYERALTEGYPEAEARELTHIQGTLDFYNHGWAELMEFPPDEIDAHWARYQGFFDRHDCTHDRPLGEFAPYGGLPPAPETPAALEDATFPFAERGLADDVYVPAERVDVRTPEGVDLGE